MSEGFEKLKKLGSLNIHKDTHIALQHVDAILNEDFSSLTKVQFLGFISILEREYHIDLSEYKEHSLELFVENSHYSSSESHLFVVAQKQRNYTPFYISIAFLIFGVVAYMSIDLAPSQESTFIDENKVIKKAIQLVEDKLDTKIVQKKKNDDILKEKVLDKEEVVQEIQPKSVEEVVLKREESDKKIQEVELIDEDKVVEENISEPLSEVEHELLILPRSKVWFGYIDLKTGKKKSLTVKSSFKLTLENSYLFMFGHGRIDMELGDKEYHYKSAKTLRLLYEDGKFTKLNVAEFKALNKGKKW